MSNEYKVGQTVSVKQGAGSNASFRDGVILEYRVGMVKSYLIDMTNPDSPSGYLGNATVDKSGGLVCTTAIPYKDVGDMDLVAQQLGF